jgi:hypothetical protein
VISRWFKYITAAGIVLADGENNVNDELVLSGQYVAAIKLMLILAPDAKVLAFLGSGPIDVIGAI